MQDAISFFLPKRSETLDLKTTYLFLKVDITSSEQVKGLNWRKKSNNSYNPCCKEVWPAGKHKFLSWPDTIRNDSRQEEKNIFNVLGSTVCFPHVILPIHCGPRWLVSKLDSKWFSKLVVYNVSWVGGGMVVTTMTYGEVVPVIVRANWPCQVGEKKHQKFT